MMSGSWLGSARTEIGPLEWASLPPPWLLTLLIVVAAVWVRAVYMKERGRARPWQRHVLAFLRVAALVAILLVLGGPYRESTRTATERSHLVVLVDNSASMRVKDTYEPDVAEQLMAAAWPDRPASEIAAASRGELVKRVLGARGQDLLTGWADRFELHVFAFDKALSSVAPALPVQPGEDGEPPAERATRIRAAIDKLPMDGGGTSLGGVLRKIANEYGRSADRHLAGVVLISDGRDTSEGEGPIEVLSSLGPTRKDLRVVAVGLGNPASGSNLWVEAIRAKDEVLVRDEVIFETQLKHIGFDNLPGVRTWLRAERTHDAEGNRIAKDSPDRRVELPSSRRFVTERTDVELGPKDEPTKVSMRTRFDRPGTYRVTIQAELPQGERAKDSVPEDDQAHHDITVKDERIRVLYLDGRPGHDWRFLSNYLTREPPPDERFEERRSRFMVHVLLQSADRQFRQPTSQGSMIQPLRSLPRTRKELLEYDVIILGDVDLARFPGVTPDESKKFRSWLVEAVDRGAGLVLQAGWEYRNPLSYLEPPMSQLLPIEASMADRDRSEMDLDRPFNIQLTDVGREHPVFQVIPSSSGGVASSEWVARVWRGDHPTSEEWQWYWLYRASGGLRPGATALARVRTRGTTHWLDDRGRPLTVFATMPFGKGRVFWSSLDMISRIRREKRDAIYGAFWEQIIRYVATYRLLGGNRRYKIFSENEYYVGDIAKLTISALDPEYEPMTDPFLDGVRIESPDGEMLELVNEQRPKSLAEEGQPGTYIKSLPLRQQGQYRVLIEVDERSSGSRRVERAERRFTVKYRAREDILKVPDHETLAQIVKATNPPSAPQEVLRLDQLGEIDQRLTARPRERVLDRRQHKQWDKWWVLAIFAGLLGLEWALRKRWQMV